MARKNAVTRVKRSTVTTKPKRKDTRSNSEHSLKKREAKLDRIESDLKEKTLILDDQKKELLETINIAVGAAAQKKSSELDWANVQKMEYFNAKISELQDQINSLEAENGRKSETIKKLEDQKALNEKIVRVLSPAQQGELLSLDPERADMVKDLANQLHSKVALIADMQMKEKLNSKPSLGGVSDKSKPILKTKDRDYYDK